MAGRYGCGSELEGGGWSANFMEKLLEAAITPFQ
jgi:hypothetical protein